MRPGGMLLKESFEARLARCRLKLTRKPVEVLQVNLGKRCNLACIHCHVEAGPKRREEMTRETAEAVARLMDAARAPKLDLTGGAPEMNRNFRFLVEEGRRRGLQVMDRCNLTVFFVDGYEDLPEFLAENQVEVIASLPCYLKENVEAQRGKGVFDESIRALRRLNKLGYGKAGSDLKLHLVYNPVGAYLPPDQAELEADYKKRLGEDYQIVFNRLFTLTNMPIRRFETFLRRSGELENYQELLIQNFNPGTVDGLMCRITLSVGWDGKIYDCDFNQMLDLCHPERSTCHPERSEGSMWKKSFTLFNFTLEKWNRLPILTGSHCFGCTAGAGSSCGGALTTPSIF